MGGCTYENWTLLELRDALQDAHKDNKHIVVPMFQRGLRWDNKRKMTFIDSMQKGFPVGTMLFYETIDGNKRNYILVDGLQRSNCIREFINNPTKFIEPAAITEESCQTIVDLLGLTSDADFGDIRRIIMDFVKEAKTFKNLQYYYPAKKLIDFYEASDNLIGSLITSLQSLFEDLQHTYDRIAGSVIPVIIYTGQSENLPAIFDRIDATDKFYVLGCRKGQMIFKFPISFFEERLNNLNTSVGDNGEISHWHVVIFIDNNDHATMLISHPELQEIDITEYLIKANEA